MRLSLENSAGPMAFVSSGSSSKSSFCRNPSWTEAFPIRTPDNLQFRQHTRPELAAELPYYAFVQAMCAVVTNGKIHAVYALAVAETFVPGRHCASDVDPNSASMT